MVSIHVGDKFSRQLAAEMLGMEIEELEGDEEVKDMMGELGNIIGGNLKSAFNDAGLACALSTPSFTTGTDFRIESFNMEKYERFAFRSDDNIVFVELGVKISELVQTAVQQGKDIHYSVGTEAADEDPATLLPDEAAAMETAGVQPASDPPPSPEDAPQPADTTTAEPLQPAPPVPSFQEAKPKTPDKAETRTYEDLELELLLDIPLEIKVELGRTRIQIQELLKLAPGSAIKLVRLEGEPVDILANDTLIARGEVVVQKEKYGIRVTEITSRMDRIRSFSI